MAYDPTTWNHEDVITSQKLNKIEKGLTDVTESAIFGFGGAQQSSNGLTPLSYLNAGDPMPSNPKKGDTVFIKDGNDFTIYSYDGEQWNIKVDPNLSQRLSDTLKEAKDSTDKAIADNNTEINETINQVAKEQADLAIKDADFNEQAQAMADKALSDAKANTATVAQDTLNSANQNLSAAKSDLTNSIASEASARNAAVAAANSQAQTYANQAKSDALSAVNKEVSDRVAAVGALDTKATNAVNQAKSDINATIKAISVGGRNLLLGTAKGFTGIGLNKPNVSLGSGYYLAGGRKVSDLYNQYGSSGYLTISFDWVASGDTISGSFNPMWNQSPWSGLSISGAIYPNATNTSGHYKSTAPLTSGYSTGTATAVQFRQDNLQGNITISNLKLESGNQATDWTPAPEDVVLDYTTKDNQIKETISQYQTTNDGKVSKAQTDATTALGLVATKVSQTDYDTKTGDLTTKYTQVKQTADSQATDIVDIKATATSQASKINSISSDVDGTKQSISDIETTQDSQSDKINQITTDVNGTKQSITDIQTKNGQQDTRMGTIETSVSGVKSDFSSYKTTNDGLVKTAQTTAQTAVDGLKTKVSQNDYDKKTGQLQTDLTSTTQTANKATTDIVSIQQKDTSQDARMTQIESDASGLKTTVSDLQTTQGKQSGDISTLQQRADGFDATVTKINTMVNSLGQTNQLMNTEFTPDFAGWINGNYAPFVVDGSYKGSIRIRNTATVAGNRLYSGLISVQGVSVVSTSVYNDSWSLVRGYDQNKKLIGELKSHSMSSQGLNVMNGISIPSTVYYIDFGVQSGVNSYVSQPMLVFESTVGQYVQGNYNNNDALAKVKLTADKATLDLSTYKTDADGRISKAQADIVTNANAITQKVSQTDYNAKTGDLDTRVTKAQTTADGAVTTVGNYKTSNDSRVSAAESKIEQNSKDITTKVSQTDYNQKTGELSGYISTLKQRADGFDTTVTKVNNLAVGGRNYIFNASGMNASSTSRPAIQANGVGSSAYGVTVAYNSDSITLTYNANGTQEWYYALAEAWQNFSDTSIDKTKQYTISVDVKGTAPAVLFRSNGSVSNSFPINNTGWTRIAYTFNFTDSSGKFWLRLNSSSTNGINGPFTKGQILSFRNFKLETGNQATDWTSSPEDTDNKISTVSQKVDSIANIVSDPSTGLSTRVQTAEGALSKVQGTDIPALQNATFWQPYSSLNFNDYTKQGSFFFNTTSAKTNGPVTGNNSWLYLIVDQGTSDNTRIKQTAWYDGVAGVKITYVRTLNSGTWSPWYANDNDSVTTISQTNSSIKQEISDRQTGDNNTLQSSKDFTSSSITSAVNGVNSTITQTSDSLIAKINTKTDQQTVLALLKNNWSIGINDNIGGIVSGIVGNTSQMSLISKKVVIDSPSTQITGTAWINSAMIQNGSIVDADIADAAITSAKIATLDVAKITGDVSSFIQSNWNGTYGSTTITASGMEVQSGSMTTLFDYSGAHFTQGARTARYSFSSWIDNQGAITTSTGLGIGLTGDDNSFVNIIGSSGASVALVAGSTMDYGANANIVRNAFNLFADTNIRSRLLFKGNNVVTSTYIEADEIKRTMNFYTDNAKDGNGNWFWFNHKVLSTGTFSSTSLLSKKNVIADYEEDALSEISKTDIVEFEYKNDVGEKHISPIIDDVNDEKNYYIPKTILGQDGQYVDMYSMISMAWKAIQQLNEKMGDK